MAEKNEHCGWSIKKGVFTLETLKELTIKKNDGVRVIVKDVNILLVKYDYIEDSGLQTEPVNCDWRSVSKSSVVFIEPLFLFSAQ
jgi:hypothetical protein